MSKFIEIKDGKMINIEKCTDIILSGIEIAFYFGMEDYSKEYYESEEIAQKEYSKLKEVLCQI